MQQNLEMQCDVLVVGAGNAALTAALAAQEQGARVMVIEKAPHDLRGGNTRFSGGPLPLRVSGAGRHPAAAALAQQRGRGGCRGRHL